MEKVIRRLKGKEDKLMKLLDVTRTLCINTKIDQQSETFQFLYFLCFLRKFQFNQKFNLNFLTVCLCLLLNKNEEEEDGKLSFLFKAVKLLCNWQ